MDLTSSCGETCKTVDTKDQYATQCVRGAYITTVCQPKSAYNLSFAAQATDLQEKKNVKKLNLNSLSLLVFMDTLIGPAIGLENKHVTPPIT